MSEILKEADDLLNEEASSDLLSEVDSLLKEPQKKYTATESFIGGAQQGATLGFKDEIEGLKEKGMSGLQDLLYKAGVADNPSPYTVDQELTAEGAKGLSTKSAYESARDEYRAADKAMMDQNFGSYMGGGLTGALLTTPLMPTKAIAPLASVGKMAPALTTNPRLLALLGKQAATSAVNSIPLSVATGVGMSEADNLPDLGVDVANAALTGMVASPLLEKAVPAVIQGAKKVGEKTGEAINMLPGEPLNRFKLGLRGVLGVSQTTQKKIQDIISKQVDKFRGKIDEVELDRLNKQNVALQNIETQIIEVDKQVESLAGEYQDLVARQSQFKTDAISTKKGEASDTLEAAKQKIKDQIESLENQKKSLLSEYETETYNSIKSYESDLEIANKEKEALKGKEKELKELRPRQIADATQQAFETDKAQIKSNYDVLDADLKQRDIKFNITQDLKDFENTIKSLARGDEELEAINQTILKPLKKYKGTIDRDTLIDLINGFKDKYGKQQSSAIKMIRSKIKDPTYSRLYGDAFDSLEDSVRKTQDFQLREFGHADLADQYAQNNKAYRAVKLLEKLYADQGFSSNIVGQIADLGKFGDAAVNKGAKGIISDIQENAQNLPTMARILPEQIQPYITESTQQLPKEMLANTSKIGNIEDLLSQLRSNKNSPSKFTTDPKEVELLTKISELEAAKAAASKNLQQGIIDPDSQSVINKLNQEIDDLNTGINPKIQEYETLLKGNQDQRKKLLADKAKFQESKSQELATKPKITELDKILGMQPADRDTALRNLITKADVERTIGGRGSDVEKLQNLAKQVGIDSPELEPEMKKLQDLLSAYKDNVNFAFNKAGGVAAGGETLGAVSNILGYGAGVVPRKIGETVVKPLDEGLKYIGKKNIVPTKDGGYLTLDDMLSKISNKPLDKILEMDQTSKAALKNNLLQISPEYRKYMEEESE